MSIWKRHGYLVILVAYPPPKTSAWNIAPLAQYLNTHVCTNNVNDHLVKPRSHRFDFIMIVSLWYLTHISPTLLPGSLFSCWMEKTNPESCGFDTSLDLVVKPLTTSWIGARNVVVTTIKLYPMYWGHALRREFRYSWSKADWRYSNTSEWSTSLLHAKVWRYIYSIYGSFT